MLEIYVWNQDLNETIGLQRFEWGKFKHIRLNFKAYLAQKFKFPLIGGFFNVLAKFNPHWKVHHPRCRLDIVSIIIDDS